MDRPAVPFALLAVEPDVLQGHLSVAGKGNQRARVGVLGSILTVRAADQRPGGIRGAGGVEDIPVLRRPCFGSGEGDGASAVIDQAFVKVDILQHLQLQTAILGLHFGIGSVLVYEFFTLRGFKASFQRGIDSREQSVG